MSGGLQQRGRITGNFFSIYFYVLLEFFIMSIYYSYNQKRAIFFLTKLENNEWKSSIGGLEINLRKSLH